MKRKEIENQNDFIRSNKRPTSMAHMDLIQRNDIEQVLKVIYNDYVEKDGELLYQMIWTCFDEYGIDRKEMILEILNDNRHAVIRLFQENNEEQFITKQKSLLEMFIPTVMSDPDIGELDCYGPCCPLQLVSDARRLDLLSWLVSREDIDINRMWNGNTALTRICQLRHYDFLIQHDYYKIDECILACKILINAKANVNLTEKIPPLCSLIINSKNEQECFSLLQFLIQSNADVNQSCQPLAALCSPWTLSSMTPLFFAIRECKTILLKTLLEAKANIKQDVVYCDHFPNSQPRVYNTSFGFKRTIYNC